MKKDKWIIEILSLQPTSQAQSMSYNPDESINPPKIPKYKHNSRYEEPIILFW